MARRYGASRMATRDFATHHMRVLSLAIASSVGESIVQHARAVKSDLTAQPAPATLGDYMRSPAPLPTSRRLRTSLSGGPDRVVTSGRAPE